jgi:hypothetical protein
MPISWNEIRQNAIRFSREWAGAQREDAEAKSFWDADLINIKAVEILGDLHDALAEGGYTGHDLERFLVRILFCLFAEDTGLFEPETFTLYLENRTAKDGSDLGLHLAQLFEVLDTPPERRQKNLDELLASFPYVNGELFRERLGFASFNRSMRDALMACTNFDWSRISPAIFGSLFQGIMDPKERRQTGGHYTSERDILKVINSLFMDDLRERFEKARHSKAMLKQFHEKMGQLHFFDPACGCGNFLVITYRELRLLEVEVLKALLGKQANMELDIHALSRVDVDAFTGIEIQEWPARIAEVAMWLMDHQMNMRLSETFGQYFVRLPLKKSAHIVNDNALRLNWRHILNPAECSFILGNPPFVGKKEQDAGQKKDMELIWGDLKGSGILDYVTAWYRKTADFIQNTAICVGFVSTNSISQGEQVGVLWNYLYQVGIRIHFAHSTFPWESEARGKAHVHVVIIGFGNFEAPVKRLYEHSSVKPNLTSSSQKNTSVMTVTEVENINPYLVAGPCLLIINRSTPISCCPSLSYGSFALDDGNFTLSELEYKALIRECPDSKKFIRPFIGGKELLHGERRYCLWLKDADPAALGKMPAVLRRIEAVRQWRQNSDRETTKKLASTPAVFAEIRQPETCYLAIPTVSSERRNYIPIDYLKPTVIASNQLYVVENATLYHFGVLTSAMHMAWIRQICGRLKSDYRYSSSLVYNNFPWPRLGGRTSSEADSDWPLHVRESSEEFLMTEHDDYGYKFGAPKQSKKSVRGFTADDKKRMTVEVKAQAVLDARAKHPLSTLADLYDPLTMPADLVKAHAELDRAVDQCYRSAPFTSDRQRVEFLFALYEQYTSPLLPIEKKPKRVS